MYAFYVPGLEQRHSNFVLATPALPETFQPGATKGALRSVCSFSIGSKFMGISVIKSLVN